MSDAHSPSALTDSTPVMRNLIFRLKNLSEESIKTYEPPQDSSITPSHESHLESHNESSEDGSPSSLLSAMRLVRKERLEAEQAKKIRDFEQTMQDGVSTKSIPPPFSSSSNVCNCVLILLWFLKNELGGPTSDPPHLKVQCCISSHVCFDGSSAPSVQIQAIFQACAWEYVLCRSSFVGSLGRGALSQSAAVL